MRKNLLSLKRYYESKITEILEKESELPIDCSCGNSEITNNLQTIVQASCG